MHSMEDGEVGVVTEKERGRRRRSSGRRAGFPVVARSLLRRRNLRYREREQGVMERWWEESEKGRGLLKFRAGTSFLSTCSSPFLFPLKIESLPRFFIEAVSLRFCWKSGSVHPVEAKHRAP
ncbi:hypothetical protein DM860_014010 [Cuscuta australis]|uniref:Uncharacterized protein n=1 Tax=Cuscuta australis TaxID=267555 RepID=A0A328DNR1_9ASTE|nr:hypothetical protein DM860_014010 [Cuscuta australis]